MLLFIADTTAHAVSHSVSYCNHHAVAVCNYSVTSELHAMYCRSAGLALTQLNIMVCTLYINCKMILK